QKVSTVRPTLSIARSTLSTAGKSLVSLKMRSLGACIQTWGKKAKTRFNIEEGNFNKLDDLVGEGVDYAVNEGRSIDKIKVLNTEAK
nr:hypothetical protein [Tanacetum cinerariifolium]